MEKKNKEFGANKRLSKKTENTLTKHASRGVKPSEKPEPIKKK